MEREVQPIIFTQDYAIDLHYPHCEAPIIKAVITQNELKRMLVDSESSINILFSYTYDKMQVDHNLTLMTSPLDGFTGDSIIPRENYPCCKNG